MLNTEQQTPTPAYEIGFERVAPLLAGDRVTTEIIARHAAGYAPGKHGLAVAGYVDMTIPFAAGGLYSTTEDVLRWPSRCWTPLPIS